MTKRRLPGIMSGGNTLCIDHFSAPSRFGSTKTQCWLKCEDLCSMSGFLKSQREEELSAQDVRTLGCKSGCSTTRKRASNLETMQDTCTLRHCKFETFGKKLCVVGKPGCRPGAKVQTYTKCQSSQHPELVLFPNNFTCVRKRVSCSERLFCHMG